jgi:hypothetical protein
MAAKTPSVAAGRAAALGDDQEDLTVRYEYVVVENAGGGELGRC